jgi:lipopolysaccharide transport system ATP-binding protein
MQPIIRVENLSKQYRLGTIGTGTLSNDLKRWWYRVRGLEDPFLKIGESNDRAHKGDSDYVWALKDINFEVMPGEVLGIIGKNGAGKSTLLKILSKVTGPTTGRIDFNGRIGSLLEVGTGFHPELTGRENIFLNGAILGMTKAEIRSKLDEIIAFAGVERYIDTPVKRYSSGMTVRLGFAVAAHLEPEILVVDEVLAVGDAEFQKKAIGKMQDVSRNEGRTVLFVSHNMTAVKNLCTKGIILKNGIVNFEGSIDQTIDNYLGEQILRSSLELNQISDRSGNGILKFTSIDLFDKKGLSRNTFEVGEEVLIKIGFTTSEEFLECTSSRIDVGINNLMSERVTWLSTFIFTNVIERNSTSITFKINQLLLTEGKYTFNLYCETNLGVADWIQNAKQMEVVYHDFYRTGKVPASKQGFLISDFSLV